MTYKQLRALLAVGYFANRDHGNVWASNRTLAEIAGLDVRDLRRALVDLEARGYLRRTRRAGPKGGDYTSLVDILLDEGVQSVAQGEGRFAPPGEGRNAPGGEGRCAPPKDTEERQHSASTTAAAAAFAFSNPDVQHAYQTYRRAARDAVSFDGQLRSILTGMTSGKPVAEEALGQALLDMAANGELFNSSRVRGYLRKQEMGQQLTAQSARKPDVDEYGLSTKRLTPWTLSESELAEVARESRAIEAEKAAKAAAAAARQQVAV